MGRHHQRPQLGAPGWQHLALGLAVAATAGGAGATVHVLGEQTTTAVAPVAAVTPVVMPAAATCDLSAPPVFGDPAHPNVITNRDCGYADERGRARSRDAWIDDQLAATR